MIKRKTAEVKFRVTPDEKARWQALAEVREESLSTLIRAAVNRECLARTATSPFIPSRDDENPACPVDGSRKCDPICSGCAPTSGDASDVNVAPPWSFEARDA